MIATQSISPGSIVEIDGAIYRVESVLKVTLKRGSPFYKIKLHNLQNEELI